MNLILIQINFGLIKEDNFIINLRKNGLRIILMYSTHNEGKSVIAERFIKTLKTTIYKK